MLLSDPFLDTDFLRDIKRCFIAKKMEKNNIEEVIFKYNEQAKTMDISINTDTNNYTYNYCIPKKRHRKNKKQIDMNKDSGYESSNDILQNNVFKTDSNNFDIINQSHDHIIYDNKNIHLQNNINEIDKQDVKKCNITNNNEVNLKKNCIEIITKEDLCQRNYLFIEDFISNIIKYNNLDQLKNFVIDTLNNVREFYNILGIKLTNINKDNIARYGKINYQYINDKYCKKVYILINEIYKVVNNKKNKIGTKYVNILLENLLYVFKEFGFDNCHLV